MSRRTFEICSQVGLFLVALVFVSVPSQASERYAVLVGINEYPSDSELGRLNYAINDVHELAATLQHAGYPRNHIHVLTSDDWATSQPTKANLIRTLQRIFLQARDEKESSLMFVFSGHGFNSQADSYICPVDYRTEAPESSSICVADLSKMLADSPFNQKLVVLDACRNDVHNDSTAFHLVTGLKQLTVENNMNPQGTVFFSSCLAGQKSWEMIEDGADQGHGVFMKFFIQGLQGEADHASNFDGRVTVSELANFVSTHTRRFVKEQLNEIQIPWYDSHSTSDMPIATLSPRQMRRLEQDLGQVIRKLPSDNEGSLPSQPTTQVIEPSVPAEGPKVEKTPRSQAKFRHEIQLGTDFKLRFPGPAKIQTNKIREAGIQYEVQSVIYITADAAYSAEYAELPISKLFFPVEDAFDSVIDFAKNNAKGGEVKSVPTHFLGFAARRLEYELTTGAQVRSIVFINLKSKYPRVYQVIYAGSENAIEANRHEEFFQQVSVEP